MQLWVNNNLAQAGTLFEKLLAATCNIALKRLFNRQLIVTPCHYGSRINVEVQAARLYREIKEELGLDIKDVEIKKTDLTEEFKYDSNKDGREEFERYIQEIQNYTKDF